LNKKESGARLSKREQLRAERRRRSLVWNVILLGGGGLAILMVAIYFIALANARPGPLPGELSAPRDFPDEGTGLVPEGAALTFQHYPPSSGAHYESVAPWGVYAEAVAEGVFVHNLENGGVVFLYDCDPPCPDLVQKFEALARKAPPDSRFGSRKILVTPYDKSKMETPIVALAWNHQLNMPAFDEATMLQWYQRFVNTGPKGLDQP
jgi:hypothetical protein